MTVDVGALRSVRPQLFARAGAERLMCGRGLKHGLRVAADDVTLDLGGHRVFGTEVLNAADGQSPGVRLDGTHGSRVTNGEVSNFNVGVEVVRGCGNSVDNLDVHDPFGPWSKRFGDGNPGQRLQPEHHQGQHGRPQRSVRRDHPAQRLHQTWWTAMTSYTTTWPSTAPAAWPSGSR